MEVYVVMIVGGIDLSDEELQDEVGGTLREWTQEMGSKPVNVSLVPMEQTRGIRLIMVFDNESRRAIHAKKLQTRGGTV